MHLWKALVVPKVWSLFSWHRDSYFCSKLDNHNLERGVEWEGEDKERMEGVGYVLD